MSPVQSLVLRDGLWRRRGWHEEVEGESALRPTNYGSYQPQEGVTAGVYPGTTFTQMNPTGDKRWRINSAGTYSNYEVWGCIKPEAQNIIVENSLIHGLPTGDLVNGDHQPLVDNVSSLTNGGMTIYRDCTFIAQAYTGGVDVAKGGNARYERCVFRNGIDGIQVYDRNTEILGCIIGNMKWISNDPAHGAEGSHNDGIQFQGGSAAPLMTVIGTVINMGINPAGSSCIGILITADRGTAGGYTFNYNWVYTKQADGTRVAHPINIAVPLPGPSTISVRGNRIQLGKSGWHVIAPSAIKTKILSEPGNVDLDTGAPIIVATGTG